MTKRCSACGQIKPLSEFYRNPKMGDGHLNQCKSCKCKYYRDQYCKNKKRSKKTVRPASKQAKKFAVALHFAQQRGEINVAACMKAVRYDKFEVRGL